MSDFLPRIPAAPDSLADALIPRLYESALDPVHWRATLSALPRDLEAALAGAEPCEPAFVCRDTGALEALAAAVLDASARLPNGAVNGARLVPALSLSDPHLNALLGKLIPHLENCIRIQHAILRTTARVRQLEDALNTLAVGLLLVDRGERVVYANRRAQEILRDARFLDVQAERLVASPEAAQQRLRMMLSDVHARRAPSDVRRAAAMRLESGDGRAPLRLVAVPAPDALGEPFVSDHCVVFLYANPISVVDKQDFLKQAFSLTTTEARCALRLIAGESLDEIAAGLGIAKATLRAHLRSLFAKTGTHRQGALIARLGQELAMLEIT